MREPKMRLVSVQNSETRAERRKGRRRAVFSLRALKEVALTVGAVLGVLCLASTAAALVYDVRPVVFESGSMAPAVDTGALGIARTVPASDLAVGDVVTVRTGEGVRVTHRIQDISFSGEKATLVLKGDANKVADEKVYVVESAPRLLFDVPKAGYVVSFVSGPIGIFAGGLLVGVVLLTVFRPGNPRSRRKGGGTRKALSAVAVTVVGTCVTGVFSGAQTQAYYTDSASMTSGTFSRPAAPPTPPTITVCQPGSGNSETFLTWTYPANLGNPDIFRVKFAGAGAPPTVTFDGTVRGPVDLAAAVNNKTGTLWIVSVVNGVESAPSNVYKYQGNGGNRTCTPN
ncbi:signal peptidase I [Aeromicrobium sp. NPDC092404]|uniref:signal peptidase I n=1 Tax=Aeromicrobium sp. NPDC092404 TaxID=3154976 RepID=UPI003444A36B